MFSSIIVSLSFCCAEALCNRSLSRFTRLVVLRDVFIDQVVVILNISILKTYVAVVLITVGVTCIPHCSVPCYCKYVYVYMEHRHVMSHL